MKETGQEEDLLRSVALQNASSILRARSCFLESAISPTTTSDSAPHARIVLAMSTRRGWASLRQWSFPCPAGYRRPQRIP